MKNFLRRLKFYGIGFGIGLLFVFFFFRNRGCTWLPSNRVKNSILGRVLVVSDEQRAKLNAAGIGNDDLIGFLNDGDVDFGASNKQGNPQVYTITRKLGGKEVRLWFTLPKDAYISEVLWPKGSVFQANSTKEGMGDMVHFPNVEKYVYLDTNSRLTCQQDKLGLISVKDVQERLVKTGKIDFGRSNLKSTPYPKQYILFRSAKGIAIETETHWYQEHIQIDEFILKDSIGCGGN